ncbi:DUF2924 domain-containing protein [Ottowia testudinis]|uniref:DUF2924 domain-containing protein n=1 Tax=Ottowia testudinis TaxID=2816950 RepID=A0A975CIB7_9BURK|nr:DUF2924 domain-containing protein [Ottowia testudinis]QTD46341.1 DUF2924 domain-containing protein [Ottowia testudinis]
MNSSLTPVAERLQALENLDREALAQRFEHVFGIPAPARSRQTFLKLALGWQLQMQAKAASQGQRPPTPIQSLRQIGRLLSASGQTQNVSPDARLIREWQGVTHEVEVLASGSGYRYQTQTFKSLSAVAKAITGTPWSGPVFFGLKGKVGARSGTGSIVRPRNEEASA